MKTMTHAGVEEYRIRTGPYKSDPGYSCGLFKIPYKSRTMTVLVSDGTVDGWEHVSVSLENRNPNWEEMCFIKDLFWYAEEAVVQYHPPKSEYVNNHPYCLHLWRQLGKNPDLPPWWMVGVKKGEL